MKQRESVGTSALRWVLVLIASVSTAQAQTITGMLQLPTRPIEDSVTATDGDQKAIGPLFVVRATGELEILETATTDLYEAYFHVPIVTEDQAPVQITVSSPELVDVRYLQVDPINVLAVATLRAAPPGTPLNWEALVLTRDEHYTDRPVDAPIPTPDDIPDEVAGWLEPTDCVQTFAPLIQDEAAAVRGGLVLLDDLAQAVVDRAYAIPGEFPHEPISFDAYYALRWGSSCTGHAHAATALFRANGVPARSLHVIPTWTSYLFDMHWITEYFVPGYRWVRVEPSTGEFPASTPSEIVTFVCRPEDEFPLYFPSGIDGHWHTSDPALGMFSPDWGGAHFAEFEAVVVGSPETLDLAFSLARRAFELTTGIQGIGLTSAQTIRLQAASDALDRAMPLLLANDADGFVSEMEDRVRNLELVRVQLLTTVLLDDFETGAGGWTHGGAEDEWELGTPTFGPPAAHSGTACWGTDLDNTYENNADCWLLSPAFSLDGYGTAYLSFWVFNEVQDENQGWVYDPLWLDLTVDGQHFVPLCSHMGGVNDDPDIPVMGGWSHVVLDLTRYAGEDAVQIRFRFQSDGSQVQPGSYVDDVHAYGRILGQAPVTPRDPSDRVMPSGL
jgi:transglutaminase-like putative cysteine protease